MMNEGVKDIDCEGAKQRVKDLNRKERGPSVLSVANVDICRETVWMTVAVMRMRVIQVSLGSTIYRWDAHHGQETSDGVILYLFAWSVSSSKECVGASCERGPNKDPRVTCMVQMMI